MIVVSGSSNQLYYDAVCQFAAPAKKEGRIWVKSAVPMASFEFVNPWNGAPNGTVVVSGRLGGDNPGSWNNVIEVFHAKRNGINHREKIAPTGCSQMQNGAWAPVDAYVCHGNTWVQFSQAWDGSLYKPNDQCTGITGGWSAGYLGPSANFSFVNGSMRLSSDSGASDAWGMASTNQKISLRKGMKNLTFECNGTNGGNRWFGLTNSRGTKDFVAAYKIPDGSGGSSGYFGGTYSLDISNVAPGDYYVSFRVAGVWAQCNVSKASIA